MAATKKGDIQTARIPFVGNPNNRDTVTSKDQRFVNAYFDVVTNAEGQKYYYLVKRPGYALHSAPSAAANGRGCYSWRGDLYSVWGNKIYKNTSDLGVTLGGTSGICGIAETRPGAATQYLSINDGLKLYAIATDGTVTTVTTIPNPNTSDLVYFDQYLFTSTTNNAVYQSNADDPTTWDGSKFITGQMYNGSGVGLAMQSNMLLALSDRHVQAFYDAANASGSVLTNIEQAAQQIGCAAQDSIVFDENMVIWVSNSNSGGYSVVKMTGAANVERISTSGIERILRGEGTSISSAVGNWITIAGHTFYLLKLASANRTLVFDVDNELWLEWQSSDGSSALPFVSFTQHSNTLIGQHATNGSLYTFSEGTYQDAGSNFTVLGRFKRIDFDDDRRKFVQRASLIGDIQSSTTNVSLAYSDDDFVTTATARTLDMSKAHAFATGLSNFRRRSWQISYSGANPLRLEALELKLRMGV